MNHSFIHNGDVQLILSPNNDLETFLFKKLLDGDAEIVPVTDNLKILDKCITGGVLIRKKQKTADAVVVSLNIESTNKEIISQ